MRKRDCLRASLAPTDLRVDGRFIVAKSKGVRHHHAIVLSHHNGAVTTFVIVSTFKVCGIRFGPVGSSKFRANYHTRRTEQVPMLWSVGEIGSESVSSTLTCPRSPRLSYHWGRTGQDTIRSCNVDGCVPVVDFKSAPK